MESVAVLRPLNCSVSSVSHVQSILQRPCIVSVRNASWPTLSKQQIQCSVLDGKLVSSTIRRREGMKVLCAKTSDVSSDVRHKENPLPRATFPSGFEAVILEVCDETEIAELKLKVGDFEMHLKRSICATEVPVALVSHATPVSSIPVIESAPASPSQPPENSSTEKLSPWISLSAEKSAKLAALDASGSSGYVFVKSPKVGSFRRGKHRKPPICTEGKIIKEGQVIFFLDQFGSESPVRSDVAGEVLTVLFEEGESVGYGDPIMAVLPSFHDIE